MKSSMILMAIMAAFLTLGIPAQDAFAVGTITGVVIDAEGEAIADAHVNLTGMRHGGGRPFMAMTESNENGEFGFAEIPAGNYIITTVVFELGMDREEVAVEDDNVTEVVLQVEGRQDHEDDEAGDPGSVEVTVVNGDGDPIGGATVMLAPIFMFRRGHDNFRPLRTETNENGIATFDEVRPGNYHVSAFARDTGMGGERIEVEADENVEVRVVLQQFGHNDDEDHGHRGHRENHRRHG